MPAGSSAPASRPHAVEPRAALAVSAGRAASALAGGPAVSAERAVAVAGPTPEPAAGATGCWPAVDSVAAGVVGRLAAAFVEPAARRPGLPVRAASAPRPAPWLAPGRGGPPAAAARPASALRGPTSDR